MNLSQFGANRLCAGAIFLGFVAFGAAAGEDDTPVMSRVEQARAVLQAGRMARQVSGKTRENARKWLEAIGKALRKGEYGRSGKAARLAADLEATLGVLTGARQPGLPGKRAGLVAGPEDFLPPGKLVNVELVEPGVLIGGSQPEGGAWELLKRKGVRTIVNLRREEPSEKERVERLGFHYEFIPVTDHEAPENADVEQFLRIVDNPANRPVFVHCAAGVGRTHTMIAAWRLSHGMRIEDALAEARAFGHHKPAQVQFLRCWGKRAMPMN